MRSRKIGERRRATESLVQQVCGAVAWGAQKRLGAVTPSWGWA